MKALLVFLVMMPVLMFTQHQDSIDVIIHQEKKSIDSLRSLKEKEIQKQIVILKKIRDKIEKLKSQKKLNPAKNYSIVKTLKDNPALKPDSDAIFWEEIPRRWTGRIFNKSDTKIRIFRFTETGDKIYLN